MPTTTDQSVSGVKANRNEKDSPRDISPKLDDGEYCRPPFHGQDEHSRCSIKGSDEYSGAGESACSGRCDTEEIMSETSHDFCETKKIINAATTMMPRLRPGFRKPILEPYRTLFGTKPLYSVAHALIVHGRAAVARFHP